MCKQISNLNEVIKNKQIREATPAHVTPEKEFYIYEGKELSPQQFFSLFPIEIKYYNPKGLGKDGRTNFY